MAHAALPDAKPAYERIAGRLFQKVSPKRRHALVQLAFGSALARWAGAGYEVGSEWRFNLRGGAARHALVPDLAVVSKARLRELADDEAREEPPFAPDLAVEVVSPGDRATLLAIKIDAYLRNGSRLVLVVDPVRRTLVAHDAHGARAAGGQEIFSHAEFPGLRLHLAQLFAVLDGG